MADRDPRLDAVEALEDRYFAGGEGENLRAWEWFGMTEDQLVTFDASGKLPAGYVPPDRPTPPPEALPPLSRWDRIQVTLCVLVVLFFLWFAANLPLK